MSELEQTARIRANILAIHECIDAAARRAGRDPGSVKLIAVSKTHPPESVRAAMAADVADFGENRVQEAGEKAEMLADVGGIRWHLIGHLQRNKVRRAVAIFDLVHSVDSLRLAETLHRAVSEAEQAGGRARLPVLLQVNVAGENQKEGFDLAGGLANTARLAQFRAEVAQIVELRHLEVRGLMMIAPYVVDPESARPVFRALRELRDDLARDFSGLPWSELSMGMTGDYEVAVEEGATLVRVGRAIFGERA